MGSCTSAGVASLAVVRFGCTVGLLLIGCIRPTPPGVEGGDARRPSAGPPDEDSPWSDSESVPGEADAVQGDQANPGDIDQGPLVLTKRHWKLTFADDFRGKTGLPSDSYCFDELKPQCHVWPGTSYHCDLSDVSGAGFFPPTKANLVAAVKLFEPSLDATAMSEDEVKVRYGQIITGRLAQLNKCTWTLYSMINWMATDYQGHWAARFDPTQVEVDPSGKGTLLLSSTAAPVETDCIYGGVFGGVNCQLYAYGEGVLTVGVDYWVDPDPLWPGVYYAPSSPGVCSHGGTFTGTNCQVTSFPPHFLEETGVDYWVDTNPLWPGVFYANQSYRCKENIDYSPTLAFRNLTCPILNGGLMSFLFTNRPYVDNEGVSHPRGVEQHQGRFEAKARIPKGQGAFPANWLMPHQGGWPYDGGELDVMEARDNADEIYQTYHHGRCYLAASGEEIDATDSADCTAKGGVTTHLSKGFTVRERVNNEFWRRDHLFAVEWTDDRFDYFINNVHVGTIEVGTVGKIASEAPASLAVFDSSNFPQSPFYWILNHSTYVPPANWSSFAPQTFRIDYIRNWVACGTDNTEYCPCGGRFVEGNGCAVSASTLACPQGMAPPPVVDGFYASPCQSSTRHCINGGSRNGNRCLTYAFAPGVLVNGVFYWVVADACCPGVYYLKTGGACPYGGTEELLTCKVAGFSDDLLEAGVDYTVDVSATPPGVYYTPDFDS